jgi:hypothetical protein
MFGERPQARELPVKSMREKRKILLWPKLSLSFPMRGMAKATAIK